MESNHNNSDKLCQSIDIPETIAYQHMPLDDISISAFDESSVINEVDIEEIEDIKIKPIKHEYYACQQCGISNTDCVAKCNICHKWFCNGRGANIESASHIIHHLVKSKHKEIQLHPDNLFGDSPIECYNCGNKKIFLLGFVPAVEEAVVVLLCREPCLNSKLAKDQNWDLNGQQALIKNKSLINWLCKEPTTEEITNSTHIKFKEINELEDLWKSNPHAIYDDLFKPKDDDEVPIATLRQNDSNDQIQTFTKLINMEAEEDRKLKETQLQTGVDVRWVPGLSKKKYAWFKFQREDQIRIVPGDELKILLCEWSAVGQVVRLNESEEVCLEIKGYYDCPTNIKSGYSVEFVWKPTSFDRMKAALKEFHYDNTSISGYLQHNILGHEIDDKTVRSKINQRISISGLPELNIYQVNAVKKALISPLCLIQGPPGTGKTVTSATLVYHFTQQEIGQVLVCAPSNIAADHLAEKLHLAGLNVVRLVAKSRESIISTVDHLSLHKKVQKLYESSPKFLRLEKLAKLKEEIGELSSRDEKTQRRILRQCEHEILDRADVISCTCASAGDPRIRDYRFRQVLIDEATQATEPECMIPLVMGAKHVILVGDHRQLGPVVLCKKAAKSFYNRSLFERLVELGNKPIRLEIQYRMHPCLSIFPSNFFYDGSLQNGISSSDREITEGLPFIDKKQPMIFIHTVGQEEISSSGTSYLNRTEAANIESIVTVFLKCDIKSNKLGIITPYEGQEHIL